MALKQFTQQFLTCLGFLQTNKKKKKKFMIYKLFKTSGQGIIIIPLQLNFERLVNVFT